MKGKSMMQHEQWPELPLKGSGSSLPYEATMKGIQSNPKRTETARTKKFMNTRVGGQLSFKQQASPDIYRMKVDSGYTMLETWGHALLGQYVGRMPSHSLIKDMMNKWMVSAKYRVEEGWFIFSFESEDDQEKVLLDGPYFILGRPMLVKRVPDKFSFHRRDIAMVPLWVRLHGLGKRYWHPDILSDIGSFIGKPLYMDTVTDERKRSAYARVLVEINLAVPIKKKITLEYDDGESYDCEFFIENQPKFCKCCCSLGHNEMECSTITRRTGVSVAVPSKGISYANVIRSSPMTNAAVHSSDAAANMTDPMLPLVGSPMGKNVFTDVTDTAAIIHTVAANEHLSADIFVSGASPADVSAEHGSVLENMAVLDPSAGSAVCDPIINSTHGTVSDVQQASAHIIGDMHAAATVCAAEVIENVAHVAGNENKNIDDQLNSAGVNEIMGTVHELDASDDGSTWTDASAETEAIVEKEKAREARLRHYIANDPLIPFLQGLAKGNSGQVGHNGTQKQGHNNKKNKSKAKR